LGFEGFDLPDSLTPVFRFVLKVLLGLLAALFAVFVLAVALGMVVLSLIKSLVTWRKPPLVEMFGQFRRFRSHGEWRGFETGATSRGSRSGEVVDVEVREIRHDRHLP
jgi:prepilin signal peptidase PulO-like enzyme (type II secretory pathway)